MSTRQVLIRKPYYVISIVLVVPISILLLLSSLNGRGYGVEKNNVKSELISEIYDESGIAGSKLVSILDKTDKKKWIRHLAERPGADEIICKFTGNIVKASSGEFRIEQMPDNETTHWIQFNLPTGKHILSQYNSQANTLDLYLSFQIKSHQDLLSNPKRKNHLFLQMSDEFPLV